ncbi:MAG: prepilin-type N-terminal cleavage/methylation domain-containing protein [Verrucomicrobiales bacterium]|nr:prepilin-type N-terminal cleavage/methylation domain-containing protein [Verrucomicrobiales bacterium]
MKNTRNRQNSGFSLVEVIITVAVLGIMSAIAISAYQNVTKSSRITVAQNLVETLNNATKEFGHAQYELLSSGNTDSTDEVHILKTLQWKDPGIELGVAGPFMRQDWSPATSDDTDDYRAVWSGSYWRLIEPGETGAGLKVDFNANDVGIPVVHDDDFTPFPRPTFEVEVEETDDSLGLSNPNLNTQPHPGNDPEIQNPDAMDRYLIASTTFL